MDRSRSPRNLSDEARLLQRLAEPELPPGATDAECAAARAEAAAAVQQAANELGGHWAEAYRELATVRGPLGDEVCDALRTELGLGAECTGGGTSFGATFESQFSDIDLEIDWVEQPEDKAKILDVCHRALAGFEVTGTFAGER